MTTITLPRATVEQALEALESVYGDSCDALHALRAALAQQAEPVASLNAWAEARLARHGIPMPDDENPSF